MKFLNYYQQINLKDEREVFDYFTKNLKHSNRTFDFFVDWCRVFHNVDNIEIELNIMNYLIGKENIREEFSDLISKYPNVVSVIPILIAVREKNIEVLVDFKTPNWEYKRFSFIRKERYSNSEILDIVEFCDRIGLLQLLQDQKIKNLVDYCIGLEVGIGTNARKNRSGKIMEDIIEWHVKTLCNKLSLEYISQASKSRIEATWDLELPVDKSSRQYDFAILNNNRKLTLIETNFFSSGGSKLKSVAGEFQSLNHFLEEQEIVDKFIWITDGDGWNTAKLPLRETFISNDYIINTKMIFDGALEEIITL